MIVGNTTLKGLWEGRLREEGGQASVEVVLVSVIHSPAEDSGLAGAFARTAGNTRSSVRV